MRAMQLKMLPVTRVVGWSWVWLAACGPGPTEGPKSVDPGIQVGGVPGSTTAKIPQEQAQEAVAVRPHAAPTEEPRASEKRPNPDDFLGLGAGEEPAPDPMKGQFTLAQATEGLPGKGSLMATIRTTKGEMKCRLFEDKAPNAVANFVGLARGTRPFLDKGAWVTRPAYDGTIFHRVIKGFMVQGGDPGGNGRGEPGYTFKDEMWAGGKHDRAGLLCMANRGPHTNGMQFFITDAAAPHLDTSYTIFGECAPLSVVHAIANAPTGSGDRPEKEIMMTKVEINRGGVAPAPPAPAPAAKP